MREDAWTLSSSTLSLFQKRSGDPNPQYFSKSTAVQIGGVLLYKWGAYCSTNGRRIAGFPFLRSLKAKKARRYKWGAYCRTNWRRTAVLFRRVVGVGISQTLPTIGFLHLRQVKSCFGAASYRSLWAVMSPKKPHKFQRVSLWKIT